MLGFLIDVVLDFLDVLQFYFRLVPHWAPSCLAYALDFSKAPIMVWCERVDFI